MLVFIVGAGSVYQCYVGSNVDIDVGRYTFGLLGTINLAEFNSSR